MKKQILLLLSLLSFTGFTYAHNDVNLGAPSAIITNNTSYNLKISLQFKDPISQTQEIQEKVVNKHSNGEDHVTFSKPKNYTGYKGAKFSIQIIIQRMGVHADSWEGEFTGQNNTEYSHTFEYKPVVQNPTKIMSTVKLNMLANYNNGALNLTFTTPTEDLED